MKCKKCNKNNVIQANYCTYCGNKFTKKEKEYYKEKGLLVRLIKIKDWYDTITLSKLTGSIYWKVGTILIVLLVGLYYLFLNGNQFKIIDSNDYTFEYNSKLKEYYVYTETEETNLLLYLPHQEDKIYINTYSYNDEKIGTKSLSTKEKMILTPSTKESYYYNISLKKEEKSKNTIKVFVIYDKDINNE